LSQTPTLKGTPTSMRSQRLHGARQLKRAGGLSIWFATSFRGCLGDDRSCMPMSECQVFGAVPVILPPRDPLLM